MLINNLPLFIIPYYPINIRQRNIEFMFFQAHFIGIVLSKDEYHFVAIVIFF